MEEMKEGEKLRVQERDVGKEVPIYTMCALGLCKRDSSDVAL